jgi:hypothetical protein
MRRGGGAGEFVVRAGGGTGVGVERGGGEVGDEVVVEMTPVDAPMLAMQV